MTTRPEHRVQGDRPAWISETFSVGGHYVTRDGASFMTGHCFVERLSPVTVRKALPLVLIHGAGQTGACWTGTPDGRPGWAHFFVTEGYVVYLVDQPWCGRATSIIAPEDGFASTPAERIERNLTGISRHGRWPEAVRHTQWPGIGGGAGGFGDAAFDAFCRSQVPYLAKRSVAQTQMRDAGAELLDRIGPAIVVTHSQAGPIGWLLGDARPEMVRGIVALEPEGPPFTDAVVSNTPSRPWGIADVHLSYDPPAATPDELAKRHISSADPLRLEDTIQQTEPPRRLMQLAQIPVAVVVGDASYHARYDHSTAAYLAQAGVPTTLIRLDEHGLNGNGHMLMLEKNSLEIAKLVAGWIDVACAPDGGECNE